MSDKTNVNVYLSGVTVSQLIAIGEQAKIRGEGSKVTDQKRGGISLSAVITYLASQNAPAQPKSSK